MGLRCRTGARTSAGWGRNMFGTRYYHLGLRGVGGKRLRAALLASSAPTAASAEMKWRNGFAVCAAFEGEFSNVTRSYAGKGVVRHVW